MCEFKDESALSGTESTTGNQASDSDVGANKKRSADISSSSSVNTSPRRLYNQHKMFRMAAAAAAAGASAGTRATRPGAHDSQEESLENDSDLDSTVCLNNAIAYNKDDDVLYQLVKAIFLVCIEVPVQ